MNYSVDWVATALTIWGAWLVAYCASGPGAAGNQRRGFCLMLGGNVGWIVYGLTEPTRLWSIVFVNVVFAGMNVVGLVRRRQ